MHTSARNKATGFSPIPYPHLPIDLLFFTRTAEMPTSFPEYVSAWKSWMEEAYWITAETAHKEPAWEKNTIMTSGCLAEISYLGTNSQPDPPITKKNFSCWTRWKHWGAKQWWGWLRWLTRENPKRQTRKPAVLTLENPDWVHAAQFYSKTTPCETKL